jgi:two-component system nitrogen regulation response regulator GlnG
MDAARAPHAAGRPAAAAPDRWARAIAEAVPAIVAALRAGGPPRRLHREAMALMERPLLAHALGLTGGNQLRAARLLGLNRNTLRKRCRQLGLAPARSPRGEVTARRR